MLAGSERSPESEDVATDKEKIARPPRYQKKLKRMRDKERTQARNMDISNSIGSRYMEGSIDIGIINCIKKAISA